MKSVKCVYFILVGYAIYPPPRLTIKITKTIVQALVISRIDYCNALLYALPAYLINKVQTVE